MSVSDDPGMRVTCEMLGKSLIINNCSYFMYKQRGVFIREVKYFSFVEQIEFTSLHVVHLPSFVGTALLT